MRKNLFLLNLPSFSQPLNHTIRNKRKDRTSFLPTTHLFGTCPSFISRKMKLRPFYGIHLFFLLSSEDFLLKLCPFLDQALFLLHNHISQYCQIQTGKHRTDVYIWDHMIAIRSIQNWSWEPYFYFPSISFQQKRPSGSTIISMAFLAMQCPFTA